MTQAPRALATRISIPAALWEGLRRLGIAPGAVMALGRLPIRLLRDNVAVSTAQFFELWHGIAQASADPAVGLALACTLEGAVMPPAFLAAYHARDYRDALQRVARFKRLCAPEELTLAASGERVEVTLNWTETQGARVPPALVDASMAALLELGRRGTGVPIAPLRVELARPSGDLVTYERYYGCPVHFAARRDCLVLHPADLDRPFASYNGELLEMLAPVLEARLAKHAASVSLSEQVQWVLRRRLTAGRPDVRSVASELALSERSLQRRLTEEGESFQGLLSQTRHQRALEYLAQPELAIVDVGYLLGYEDQNSFFRAFRQWEAQTPTDWRAQQGAAP